MNRPIERLLAIGGDVAFEGQLTRSDGHFRPAVVVSEHAGEVTDGERGGVDKDVRGNAAGLLDMRDGLALGVVEFHAARRRGDGGGDAFGGAVGVAWRDAE